MRSVTRLAVLAMLVSAAPALASPNAFWTFGWRTDRDDVPEGIAETGRLGRQAPRAFRSTDGAFIMTPERISPSAWFYHVQPARKARQSRDGTGEAAARMAVERPARRRPAAAR